MIGTPLLNSVDCPFSLWLGQVPQTNTVGIAAGQLKIAIEMSQTLKKARDNLDWLSHATIQKILGYVQKRPLWFIGIGGSIIASMMVLDAFPRHPRREIRFIASLDGADAAEALKSARADNPPIVVVISKSLRTLDTIVNWQYLTDALMQKNIAFDQFVVTADPAQAAQKGFAPDQIMIIPEALSGRYSFWSPVAIPVIATLGADFYRQLVDGARLVDTAMHASGSNPVKQALEQISALDCFRIAEEDMRAWAVLPATTLLKGLPDYWQQLVMEGLGKTTDGRPTAPVVWGDIGPNAQHSFFQFIYQGTQPVISEFFVWPSASQAQVLPNQGMETLHAFLHYLLLKRGKANQRHCARLFFLKEYSPKALGTLMAFMEYRTLLLAATWGLDPFTQPGVEEGKRLAQEILARVPSGELSFCREEDFFMLFDKFNELKHEKD
jgi:glucose-6-phosphate isomerase